VCIGGGRRGGTCRRCWGCGSRAGPGIGVLPDKARGARCCGGCSRPRRPPGAWIGIRWPSRGRPQHRDHLNQSLVRQVLVVCRCFVVACVAGGLLSGRFFSCRTRMVVVSELKRPVMLTARDREELLGLTVTGVRSALSIRRARVLLALDTSAGEVDAKEVFAARLGVSGEMLRLVAKRFAETGGDIHATILRKKRDLPPVPSPVTGEVEARLIALACSAPPAGVCPVVVAAAGQTRRAHRGHPEPGPLHHRPGFEETELRPHLRKCWNIPPRANAEFAARMDDVLAVYAGAA
jgi:hypothetical protein